MKSASKSKDDVVSNIAKKRGSSFSQLSRLSRRMYAEALPDVGCGRFCRVDYLSVTGKWLTFAKLMSLVLIPVLAGWSFTIYSLADNIVERAETVEARDLMAKSVSLDRIIFNVQKERDSILYLSKIGPGSKAFLIREYERTDSAIAEMWAWPDVIATKYKARDLMAKAVSLGRIIFKVQKERDMSILYLSKIGPGSKAFLIQEYGRTDSAIAEMWAWPDDIATNSSPYFQSKAVFLAHINRHRARLDLHDSEPYDEIKFYTEIVDFLMDWMVTRIKDSGFDNTWKTLVVFHKITRCMLDTGIERAYGAMFFGQGNFLELEFYDFYFRRIHRFKYSYRSATYYSDLVDPLLDERTDQKAITQAINTYRLKIKYINITGSYKSAEDAQYYFDNMTLRVDYMFDLQNLAAERVVRRINTTASEYVTNIIVYSVVATIVILTCPVIMFLSEALTSHIQAYSKILVKASDDLDVEKNKTVSLLHQMLPKKIVERLKRNCKVESEYFKSATVLFSSIVNFTRLSIEFTPMELVQVLNVLYTSFDDKIGKYDVYKVETINDTYMVVSGVPVPNGMRHASEIAYLALDIRHMICHAVYTPVMRVPIQLHMGVSTGSVSAGIVGTAMLRYCLFGDTVNIASRMKSYSQPNRIHLSETTFRNLSKSGNFRMQSRGGVNIKGKGTMETYWLLGAKGKAEFNIPPSSYRLPGELEDISNEESFGSGGAGTSGQEVVGIEEGPTEVVTTKRRISVVTPQHQQQQQQLQPLPVASEKKPTTSDLPIEEYHLF